MFMTRPQARADAGSCRLVRRSQSPEKLMTSPTFQVVPAAGVLIIAVGAVLPPTEMVTLSVSVAPARVSHPQRGGEAA